MSNHKNEKVTLISRLDFLDPEAFRKGLLDAAAKIIKDEKCQWIIINGGLISYKGWRDLKKKRTEQAVLEHKALKEAEKADRAQAKAAGEEFIPEDLGTQQQVRSRVHTDLVDEVARNLAQLLPKIEGRRGKLVKYYYTSSPANNYDGPVGDEIAKRLEVLRDDFIFWDAESARFPLKHPVVQILWALNPTKGAWRSKYYSTSAQRLVEDKLKQTSQRLPDIFTVGTGGSAINKPAGGESAVQMITVPALHRLQGVSTAENQVGITVVEYPADSRFPLVRVYNFKDLLSVEREFIPDPEGANEMELAIIEQIRKNIPTIGMLADALPWKRSTIERAIKQYNESDFEPGIVKDEHSGKYDFDPNYIQFKLKFQLPSLGKLKRDALVGFSCLHGGYATTQYKWFINRVPELMAKYDVNVLVGCGDYIAGLKHNLDRRGELIPGLNVYSLQEELSGELIGKVLLETFKYKFEEKLSRKRNPVKSANVQKLVDNTLPELRFWRGNHDEWVQDDGHEPLYVMRLNIVSYLTNGILEYLADHDLVVTGIKDIVTKHIVYSNEHTLSSGVTLSIRHPHTGRMQTWSGRAQQTMGATPGQLVFIGNFHVAIAAHEWDPKLGQRLAMQIGSTLSGTDFESNMNKLVDTGVGIARVYSDPDTHKIFMTEVIWDSPCKEDLEHIDSNEVVRSVKDDIGL